MKNIWDQIPNFQKYSFLKKKKILEKGGWLWVVPYQGDHMLFVWGRVSMQNTNAVSLFQSDDYFFAPLIDGISCNYLFKKCKK